MFSNTSIHIITVDVRRAKDATVDFSPQRKFVELSRPLLNADAFTKRRRHFLHYKIFLSLFRQLLVKLKLYER